VSSLWPVFDRFPHLAELPRLELRAGPTPLEQLADGLWIKRDDLTAQPIGGNKVRALEFLLGPYARGDRVITAGSRGSTHVLSTILHARNHGIEIAAASWRQEMNDVARVVDARIDKEAQRRHFRSPIAAALWLSWRSWHGDHVIPPGGTSPLGMLGHMNAAFELAEQVRMGQMPAPDRVVVPLGTGGTAAGLALGFELARLNTEVVGARVVPRIIANPARVRRLIRATIRHIEPPSTRLIIRGEITVTIADGVYGGAYARPLEGAPRATSTAIGLDPTYSAKAYVAALGLARAGTTLFWLTFDSRWMKA
jgi:D-cysteine desulfhydrase